MRGVCLLPLQNERAGKLFTDGQTNKAREGTAAPPHERHGLGLLAYGAPVP